MKEGLVGQGRKHLLDVIPMICKKDCIACFSSAVSRFNKSEHCSSYNKPFQKTSMDRIEFTKGVPEILCIGGYLKIIFMYTMGQGFAPHHLQFPFCENEFPYASRLYKSQHRGLYPQPFI